METDRVAPINIIPATTSDDIVIIRELFTAYSIALGIDLTFQSFEKELASLPGTYCPLLIARDTLDGTPIGCVGVRPLPSVSPKCCEMKRLYVHPHGRGKGVGKALVDAAITTAKEVGYLDMRLDTLMNMHNARRLYKQAGFVECEPYYETPLVAVTVFLSRAL